MQPVNHVWKTSETQRFTLNMPLNSPIQRVDNGFGWQYYIITLDQLNQHKVVQLLF